MTQLNDYDKGDVLNITLTSGETFEEVTISHKDYDPAVDRYGYSHVDLGIEGPNIWEQVQDRVDIEVLSAYQTSTRGERSWNGAELHGTVWVGEPKEAQEPEYKELGTIKSIEKIKS